MILYKSSKLKFISEFAVVIMFFVISTYFLYLISNFSFKNNVEYFLAYISFLGLLAMFFFSYVYAIALPVYRYTIILQDSSLIYKKADTIIHKFDLSNIESISQKQGSQVFILNLTNKEKFLLPFAIDEMPLFLNTLIKNYNPTANYINKTIKAKRQGPLSILLILIFLPILILPLLLSPYVILLYFLGFLLTFMIQPKYLKISEREIEITNKSKTILINKEEIENIELEHSFVVKSGDFYKCKLYTLKQQYTLSNYDISDIDLYCFLKQWQKTYNKYEETNNLP